MIQIWLRTAARSMAAVILHSSAKSRSLNRTTIRLALKRPTLKAISSSPTAATGHPIRTPSHLMLQTRLGLYR